MLSVLGVLNVLHVLHVLHVLNMPMDASASRPCISSSAIFSDVDLPLAFVDNICSKEGSNSFQATLTIIIGKRLIPWKAVNVTTSGESLDGD